jgi:PAS domain S-box-containing protein
VKQNTKRRGESRTGQDFQLRLLGTQETLSTIRSGEVGALLVAGPQRQKVYTLDATEHPYRVMVETMNEGALTLSDANTIIFSNRGFAAMLQRPLEEVMGSEMNSFVLEEDLPAYQALLQHGQEGTSKGKVRLRRKDGTIVPVCLSISALEPKPGRSVCAVVTDLTEHERNQELIALQSLERTMRCEAEAGRQRITAILESISESFLTPEHRSAAPGREKLKRPTPDLTPVVIVIDEDSASRRSTERLIRATGFQVQPFAAAKDFLRAGLPDAPTCLVLNVRLPGMSGLDLQKEMARAELDVPIIFITGHGDIRMSIEAMKAGASEFLIKPFREQALLDAIYEAIRRDSAGREKRRKLAALRACYNLLTPRERDVMARVVSGLLNKQIAAELGTVEKTIKFHRAHIMKKMNARSLAELVQMAGNWAGDGGLDGWIIG